MKHITALFLLTYLINSQLQAQQRQTSEFGKPTEKELSITSFSKDPEATAVILFEQGDYHFEVISNRYIRLVKKLYRKIKVIDAKKFNEGTIEIPLLVGKNSEEKTTNLKAVTHNGILKKYVAKDDIFTINQSKDYKVIRFTFPDIKDGSVLEFEYTIESPFFFNFRGWYFQNKFPTLYSEFVNEIPGNFNYKRVLKGSRKLDVEDVSLKKNCFQVEGYTAADCEAVVYAMANIPAFKEEKYMLAKSNYIASIQYELRDFLDYSGIKNTYSKTWKDVEHEFKTDKDIGRQLKNNNFFKRNLPEKILTIPDDLEKAKSIYTFIQNHFKWNGKKRLFNEVRVRDAFEEKVGNTGEINLSLINALQAAELDAKLMLISTRDNGLPTFMYPVLTDFNQPIVLLTIKDKKYLLDAIHPQVPFGIIPFEDLNFKGRVMDFKNGSYWYPLEPNKKNLYYVNAKLTPSENNTFSGAIKEVHTGYVAINERQKIYRYNTQEYISKKESENSAIQISDLLVENKKDLNEPLKIDYKVTLDTEAVGDKIYLNPYFFETLFTENPFKSEERNFPINFGYPIATTYLISIDLEDKYTVEQLPENKTIKLFDNIGECTAIYTQTGNKINIRFSFKLTESNFTVQAYSGLKDFFGRMIEFQTQNPILLKKI